MRNPPPELFAERPVQSTFAKASADRSTAFTRRGPPYAVRRFITILVLLSIIGGGLYWAFGPRSSSVPGEIPTIKAEGSYKQRPRQPGGIDIPHQDVQVYQELDAHTAPEAVVEHLLPPPEIPQPRPGSTAPPPQQNAIPTPQAERLVLATPKSEPEISKVVSVPAQTPVPVAVVPPVSPPPAKAPPAQPTAAPMATPKPAPKTIKDILKEATAPESKADSIIQLVSVSDEAAARDSMEKLRAKYAAILGMASLRIIRADLGPKGIYYRVQSQPIPIRRAKEICADLKNLKAGCLIVRP